MLPTELVFRLINLFTGWPQVCIGADVEANGLRLVFGSNIVTSNEESSIAVSE